MGVSIFSPVRSLVYVLLGYGIAVVAQGEECLSEVALKTAGNFSYERVNDPFCKTWKTPVLQFHEVFVMKINSLVVQYTFLNPRNKYCSADLIIADANYCYMNANTCFIVIPSQEAFDNEYTRQHCTVRIFITTPNATVRFESRTKYEASLEIVYQKFNKTPPQQGLGSTVPHGSVSLTSHAVPSPTVRSSTSSSFLAPATGSGPTISIIAIVLGVLMLLAATLLGIVLCRASRMNVLNIILAQKPSNAAENLETQITTQRPTRGENTDHSERIVVVNEIYSMT